MRDLFMIVVGMLLMAGVFASTEIHDGYMEYDYEIMHICTDEGDCIDERIALVPMDAGISDGAYVVCFQTDYQDADCLKFEDVWHENIFPFEIMGVNPDYKTMFVKVDDYFTKGDDGACQSFGALINNMLEQMPEGWQIYVTNKWVPSKKNPIDLGWSRTLAEGY